MIGALLTQIGLPLLMKLVGEGLSQIDKPVAKKAANILKDVDISIGKREINIEEIKEANRHMEAIASKESEEFSRIVTEVNASLRAEIASQDAYVRRMRPTFGYIMAVTWAAQMLSVAYVILFEPQSAAQLVESIGSLSTIWTVGLSVLGIYVYKRSQEKATHSK